MVVPLREQQALVDGPECLDGSEAEVVVAHEAMDVVTREGGVASALARAQLQLGGRLVVVVPPEEIRDDPVITPLWKSGGPLAAPAL